MHATSAVKLATAVRQDAASLASRLAMRSGATDDVLTTRIGTRVSELADDLEDLASPSAQAAVGPTVNVATEARLLLGPLERTAPFRTPSPEALRGIDRLLGEYIGLAQGWASRAS